MNQKIESLKKKLANQYVKHNVSSRNKIDFEQGFDSAIELNKSIVEAFMEWLPYNYSPSSFNEWVNKSNNESKSGSEIYKSFSEHIYRLADQK